MVEVVEVKGGGNMPIVDLHVKPNLGGVNVFDIKNIGTQLKTIVAQALTPDETGREVLTEWVEVFTHMGSTEVEVESSYGIRIVITAFEFPSRATTIWERTNEITQNVRALIPAEIKFWVQVNLVKGAYAAST